MSAIFIVVRFELARMGLVALVANVAAYLLLDLYWLALLGA